MSPVIPELLFEPGVAVGIIMHPFACKGSSQVNKSCQTILVQCVCCRQPEPLVEPAEGLITAGGDNLVHCMLCMGGIQQLQRHRERVTLKLPGTIVTHRLGFIMKHDAWRLALKGHRMMPSIGG